MIVLIKKNFSNSNYRLREASSLLLFLARVTSPTCTRPSLVARFVRSKKFKNGTSMFGEFIKCITSLSKQATLKFASKTRIVKNAIFGEVTLKIIMIPFQICLIGAPLQASVQRGDLCLVHPPPEHSGLLWGGHVPSRALPDQTGVHGWWQSRAVSQNPR